MTAADFKRIALSLDGVEEDIHAGQPTFRVGGRRFAGLASVAQGYGNLTLTPQVQSAFVEEAPEIFLPIPGGFGRIGHTHIRLAAASEDVLTGALRTAWQLRIEANARVDGKKRKSGAGTRRTKG
ncbi:MAG TPA: MmcQ/YjbR family DNA-binding protein [Bryobacteraceae bacterium]|nr:MmcQ/YjbR family DNA-binding protein [Bryobacteraceae bacterium]